MHMDGLIFVVLFFCWGIADHFPPWTAFHTEAPAFIASMLALTAIWRWDGRRIKLPAVVLLVAALVLIAWLQWAKGLVSYAGDALVTSIYLVTLAAGWLFGYQRVATGQKTSLIEWICGFLLAVSLLTSFQIFAQWLQIEGAFWGWVLDAPLARKPYANVGQPNQAATTLLMGTAAILMQRGRIGYPVMWCALLMLGLAMTVTQSRTALLAATTMVVLFSFFYRPDARELLTRTSVLLWLLFIYAAAWGFQNLEWTSTKAGIGVGNMVAPGSRYLIWSQLMAGLIERPLEGFGWLQIATAQQLGSLIIPGSEQTNYAHNIVLDLFLVLGLPLGGMVLGIGAIWWWRRVAKIQGSSNAMQAFFISLPFLVHSMLEFPHAYAYFLFVVGMVLGALDAWTEGRNPWALSIPKWMLGGFIIGWSGLLAATGYEYVLAEEDFRVNRFENRRLGETPSDYHPPNLVLLTQLDDVLQAMRLRAKPGMKPEELAILVRISARYSWAPLQFRTALSLALNDRPDEAVLQLRIIKAMFPKAIYVEAKENFLRLQLEQYPELVSVEFP